MPVFDYDAILNEFGDTLENLSVDTSREREIGILYLTSSKQKAVGFDNYIHSIAEPLVPHNRPKSCDVLIKVNDNYYFIEFKNGRIREEPEGYEIREKVLESLLLFLDIIDQTISYSRQNCYFILVYNEDVIGKSKKPKGLIQIENKIDMLTHIKKYESIYMKRTYFFSKDEFEKYFIKKYCL
jgi:hypothetical protein